MKKFEYKVVNIGFSIWTGKADQDYLQILNEMGEDGWRFVNFAPAHAKPKGVKGIDLIFERVIEI